VVQLFVDVGMCGVRGRDDGGEGKTVMVMVVVVVVVWNVDVGSVHAWWVSILYLNM
jgi:hypothetical protein